MQVRIGLVVVRINYHLYSVRLSVRTSGFQPEKTSSTLVPSTISFAVVSHGLDHA